MNEPYAHNHATVRPADKPLDISVVMCTYNGARYVAGQIDSIVAQTYPIREIIIQDDGSTDQTPSILRDYAKKDIRIRVYNNDSGIHGVNGNFFSAMRRATGEYIAISDQDDIWEKDKLELQAAAIGNKWLCSGFSVPFSDDGFPVKVDMRVPNYHIIRATYLCQLPGHTLLFRRRMLDYLTDGERLPLFYDWQLVTVAAARESIAFVPRKLVNFRRHADAATATAPVGHKLISASAWHYISVSLLHHRQLQSLVRQRFRIVLPFLERLPFRTPALDAAIQMSKLQTGRGPLNFLKKIGFFLRHSRYLSFAEEHRPLVRWLRALFFVYSCGYYYRGGLKKE